MTGRGEAHRHRNMGRAASEAFNFPACAEICGQPKGAWAYGPVRQLSSGCPETDPATGAGLARRAALCSACAVG
jgi:hypothetical protein